MEGRAERNDEPFYTACAGCGMRSERSLSRSPAGGCAADSGIGAWARDRSFVGVICDDGFGLGRLWNSKIGEQDSGTRWCDCSALCWTRGEGACEVWHCVSLASWRRALRMAVTATGGIRAVLAMMANEGGTQGGLGKSSRHDAGSQSQCFISFLAGEVRGYEREGRCGNVSCSPRRQRARGRDAALRWAQ